RELVLAHPWQEELRRSLALALYRSGQQAEALQVIQDGKRLLAEELGVEPGRSLRELETAILRQDLALDLIAAAPSSGASVVAGPQPGRPDNLVATAPTGSLVVGRRSELADLRSALEEAAAVTRVAIVEGEPGIGKTRLVEELAGLATQRGALVLWSQAYEGGTAPALWPWLPVLQALAQAAPDVPAATSWRDLLNRADPVADTGRTSAWYALVDAVAALLRAVASRRQVLFVLDDLHWVDTSSLELLQGVASRLREAAVLLVCTVRQLHIGGNDELVRTLAVLTRQLGSRRLVLRGLTAAETAVLVHETTGNEPAPEVAAAIQVRADGNPFYTIELSRLLATGEGLDDIPAGVRDVVRRRLAQLPPETVALIEVASVVGRDIDLPVLARAAGRGIERCVAELEPALRHRLLIPVPDRPGRCRFAHALVREVAFADIAAFHRARLHLAVAEALDHGDDTVELIAEHLWSAAPLVDPDRTAGAFERAADVAVRRFAYATAQRALERAVELRRYDGDDPARAGAELTSVVRLVAVFGTHRGRPDLIDSPLLTRGMRLATALGRELDLCRLLAAQWSGLDQSGGLDRAERVAKDLVARAERLALAEASILAHTAYGVSCWHRGEIDESARHLDLASAAARSIDVGSRTDRPLDHDQLRIAIPFSVYPHDLIGDLADPDAAYEEVVGLVPGDRCWQLLVCNFASSGALSVGDIDRSVRAARLGVAADPDAMSAFWSVSLRCTLGAALCLRGDLAEGLPLFEESWRTYRSSGLRANGATWLASCALALARADRLNEAADLLARARTELTGYGDHFAESTVLLAEAALLAARGEDHVPVRRRAHAVAARQGAHAMADRADREA
ncbi:MAG TPA: AAA family ATPase, partial [Micromonosporaceae bacterium]